MLSCCGESEGKGEGGVRCLLREMKGVELLASYRIMKNMGGNFCML